MRRAWTAAAMILAVWAPGCFAQSAGGVTINPVMTKGPVAAPVTIVEFSDYQ